MACRHISGYLRAPLRSPQNILHHILQELHRGGVIEGGIAKNPVPEGCLQVPVPHPQGIAHEDFTGIGIWRKSQMEQKNTVMTGITTAVQ